MSKQVITVKPDGSLFSLQHKKGQGVDLRSFGSAKIERATLIEWSEDNQAWFIQWTKGPDAGDKWTFLNFGQPSSNFHHSKFNSVWLPGDPVIYFHDYEDAVRAEVAVIQNLQRSGQFVD
jgi:hypothetical protein